MTTDPFHVKLDDDHFYGILQIELACIYMYVCMFVYLYICCISRSCKKDESMFCRFGVSVIFEPLVSKESGSKKSKRRLIQRNGRIYLFIYFR